MSRPRSTFVPMLSAVLSLVSLAACKSRSREIPETASGVMDFAYDSRARNFAILAGNDGSTVRLPGGETAPKLLGVPPDIETWWSFLCPSQPVPQDGVRVPRTGQTGVKCQSLIGNFEVVLLNKATTTAEELKAALRWVGANLESNSTLILAYSGHGSETGSLYVTPESPWWPFGDILGEEPARRGVRGARFYFFNDSCFSGKLVNDNSDRNSILVGGRTSANLADGQILTPPVNDGYTGASYRESVIPPAASGLSLADGTNAPDLALLLAANRRSTEAMAKDVAKTPAFAQAVIFSAANRDQTASDLGPDKGGAFTSTLKEVFEFYFKNRREDDPGTNPSLQRVFNDVAWRVQTRTAGPKQQVPQYRVAPDCVLSEKFFITGNPTTCVDAIDGTEKSTVTPPAGQSQGPKPID